MGANIPLPELDLPKPTPAPYPNALSEFQQAAALRTAAGQQAIQAQQATGLAQQNQMQQMQLEDAQKLRQLTPQFVQKDQDGKIQGYDLDGLTNAALSNGVSPQTVNGLRNGYAESVKNMAAASKEKLAADSAKNDQVYEIIESLRGAQAKQPLTAPPTASPGGTVAPQSAPNAPVAGTGGMPSYMLPNLPANMQAQVQSMGAQPQSIAPQPQAALEQPQASPDMMQSYHKALLNLGRLGIKVGQLNPNQFPTPELLDSVEAGLGLHKQALNDNEQIAKTQEAAGKGAESQAEAGLKNIELKMALNSPPGSFDKQIDDLNLPPDQAQVLKGQINDSLGRGDVEAAKKIAAGALENIQAINKEVATSTNPVIQNAKLQLHAAEARATQAVADGDPRAAAQLLVSGAVAPSQLISSRKPAFAQQAFTAAQQMQPGWNAQKADADYKVASSPAQLAFFGSAKSLTDPGGTLDQLKAAGRDIPQGEFPIFNTMADIYKAQTGSGPIAKYAATLIGVADDYAKVTGGGAGTEGMQKFIMGLAPAKASPEQRDGAIDGFRGAVNSQVKSRIGNNTVLRNMYGDNPAAPTSAAQSGRAVSLAAAKQLPSMQGKTDDEIRQAIIAAGHQVAP